MIVAYLNYCYAQFVLCAIPKMKLTMQQNHFKIELKSLEDDLLNRLSAAHGNFLGDISLVEQLENTKTTATHIQCKVRLLHQQSPLSCPTVLMQYNFVTQVFYEFHIARTSFY